MPTQWPDLEVFDGNLAVARPCGIPQFSAPITATTVGYLFTQEFMQLQKHFIELPLNTRHPSANMVPDYSAWVLVSEGPRSDMGGGMVKWQRTYAKVPASHDEFETHAYSFIGLVGRWIRGNESNSVMATGRNRLSRTVPARVQHDYFLTGPNETYATPALIPMIRGQRYYAGATPGPLAPIETDFISDVFGSVPATSPSRTEYNTWIVNATNLGFASGIAGQTPVQTDPGQLVVEDSRLSRWQGNIWLRQTRFVLAQ